MSDLNSNGSAFAMAFFFSFVMMLAMSLAYMLVEPMIPFGTQPATVLMGVSEEILKLIVILMISRRYFIAISAFALCGLILSKVVYFILYQDDIFFVLLYSVQFLLFHYITYVVYVTLSRFGSLIWPLIISIVLQTAYDLVADRLWDQIGVWEWVFFAVMLAISALCEMARRKLSTTSG